MDAAAVWPPLSKGLAAGFRPPPTLSPLHVLLYDFEYYSVLYYNVLYIIVYCMIRYCIIVYCIIVYCIIVYSILYNELPPGECRLVIHGCISRLARIPRGAALKMRNSSFECKIRIVRGFWASEPSKSESS